ncbi:hypothetical protein TWF730_003617 [Orbilia blumenaviensis]|uniref:Uncharacterized protein n=1 Tax=Orbilia blumenaviensis TaxID=1796055 RepID=A0AAV9U378_9PEZI
MMADRKSQKPASRGAQFSPQAALSHEQIASRKAEFYQRIALYYEQNKRRNVNTKKLVHDVELEIPKHSSRPMVAVSHNDARDLLKRSTWNVIGDTNSLYCGGDSDMASEASFDVRLEPPPAKLKAPSASTSAEATTYNATSSSGNGGQLSSKNVSARDLEFTTKKVDYYSSRGLEFFHARDYCNAETCTTRWVDLTFSWPGNSIPRIWKGRYDAIGHLIRIKLQTKNWDDAMSAVELFSANNSGHPWDTAWRCGFILVIIPPMIFNGLLDRAESQSRRVLDICSRPWPTLVDQDNPVLQDKARNLGLSQRAVENCAHWLLAIIMAKKGDILEAGFYKSLVSPAVLDNHYFT